MIDTIEIGWRLIALYMIFKIFTRQSAEYQLLLTAMFIPIILVDLYQESPMRAAINTYTMTLVWTIGFMFTRKR